MRNQLHYGSGKKRLGLMGRVAILATAVVSLAACEPEPTLEEGEADVPVPTEQAAVPEGAEVGEGTSDANELIGETVTISTKVTEVVAPNIFTIYDVESLRGEEILAITDIDVPGVGTNIEVTGEILELDEAAIKAAYDVELEPAVVEAYAGRPYLAVQALEAVD